MGSVYNHWLFNLLLLTIILFFRTRKGLKTGMYYLRTRAAADAIKFTVDTSALNNVIYTYVDYQSRDDPSSEMGHHKKRSYHQFGSNKLKQLSHDILK